MIGGPLLFWFTTLVLLVAGVASSLASQAGASRLLYGMGRDRMLPPAIFAYLDPKRSTPVRSIWLMGAVSFVAALFSGFQAVVELVNFGAFAGFALVNVSVIRLYWMKRRQRSGAQLLTNLVFPALGAIVCTYVWLSLSPPSKIFGFMWLGLGVIYLAVLTRGFTAPGRKLELP
jgi:amino acid transporter